MGTNPWAYIGVAILVAFVAITGLAALISLAMSLVSRRTVNANVQTFLREIEGKLPGKNCGECGCCDCAQYAEAVLNRDLACDKCPYLGEVTPKDLETCADRFWKIADREPIKKRRFWNRRDD